MSIKYLYDRKKIAITYGEQKYSYADVIKYVNYYSEFLDISKGDRVALMMENRPESIFSFFSIWAKKGIALSLDAGYTVEQLAFVLNDSKPKYIFVSNKVKEVVEKVLDEHVPDSNDAASFDATRQFTPDEMAELQRRVAESNKQVEDFSNPDVDETNDITSTPVDFGIADSFESEVADFPTSAPVDEDFDLQPEGTGEINLNETQTFKLNISE